MSKEELQKLNEEEQVKTAETEDKSKEEAGATANLSIGTPDPKKDAEYSDYLAWKQEQKAIKAQQKVLEPIGGMDGFNKAKEALLAEGTDTLRANISKKLESNDPTVQAAGVSDMVTFMEMRSAFKSTAEKEQAMPTANLPGIGQSSAPESKTEGGVASELPTVDFTDGFDIQGVKHPRVKKAIDDMYEQFDSLLESEPLGGGSLHNIAMTAVDRTLGKLVNLGEKAFGDPNIAQEALYIWGRLNEQITERATEAGDPTYQRINENASETKYNLSEFAKAQSHGKSDGINYLEQMFPQKFKKGLK